MFANHLAHGSRRRGIVLVLILGMLGLLALIGVTFATYAGQALVNARNYNISEGRPGAEQYMDFALGQLINDTNNPLSAIRGHSLLRDMYGTDSVFRGTTAADFGGLLQTVTHTNGQTTPLYLGNPQPYSSSANQLTPALGLPNRTVQYLQFQTNIPTAKISYQYYGLNFTRWILKTNNVYSNGTLVGLSQTFEVLEDDDTGTDPFSNGNHLLTLGPIDGAPGSPKASSTPGLGTVFSGLTYLYNNPNNNGYPGETGSPAGGDKTVVSLTNPVVASGLSFVLDGRYMSAFNGPGMSRPLVPIANPVPSANGNQPFPPLVPFNVAAYANFKVNSQLISPGNDPTVNFPTNISTAAGNTNTTFGNPDQIGMDEDYDACDLENWFLALQSADGQVMIPSFHRPSILMATDWTSRTKAEGATSLYEQMNAVAGIAKILRPRQIDNSPQFLPDPSTPDPRTGRITYDIDNDGDGQTDSVWLDLGYPVQKDPGGKLFKPLFAFMVIGQNGRLPLNTVGNLQDRDSQTAKTYSYTDPMGNPYSQFATANTFFDAPTWDHTSHVGYSVNEINPKPALQNAPANTYNQNVNILTNGVTSTLPGTITDSIYSQVDNTGVDIALTQLRNLLAGTIPMDNLKTPNTVKLGNEEYNFVNVAGQKWFVPNNLIDAYDNNGQASQNGFNVARTAVTPVPGRWGEPEGIPQLLSLQNTIFANFATNYTPPLPMMLYPVYTNPVRAGRSFYSATGISPYNSFLFSSDLMDDDLDGVTPPFGATVTETNAVYDAAGQVALPAERSSRFLTPMDPSGNGQLVNYMNRPNDVFDHGSGSDKWGRISFFRYFRPPGLPQVVNYFDGNGPLNTMLAANSQYHIDLYKMAVFPNGNSLMQPNTTNNQYHSYEAFRAPAPNNSGATLPYTMNDYANIAVMASMPFDNLANLTESGNGIYQLWPLNSQTAATMNTTSYFGNNALPYVTSVGSGSGPFMMNYGSTIPATSTSNPMGSPNGTGMGTFDNASNQSVTINGNTYGPPLATVVNGYPLGSLNKDEADEMNLYTPNRYDQQFGPSDLEWLYRLQDVDGSTLSSRLSSLAPVSFLNPADGQTRRRLFSLESWEPNNFVWANDNPLVFNTAAYISGTSPTAQPLNPYNSRFATYANASFANLNQVPPPLGSGIPYPFANINSVEMIPNPLLDAPIIYNAANPTVPALTANPDQSYELNYVYYPGNNNSKTIPLLNNTGSPAYFYNANSNNGSSRYPNLTNGLSDVVNSTTSNATYPVPTPALAHRDRRINLNMPLPIANDPAEPVRQKWCRDTYLMLKAILPPQAIDTPQELAALSQYVVNIIDFRDPDATMTRFVNTDLMIVPATSSTPSGVQFAAIPPPPISVIPIWDPAGNVHTFFPYDPMIAAEQSNPSADWITAMTDSTTNTPRPLYLVQYGMEYNPIAINEVLAYSFYSTNAAPGTASTANIPTPRFYVELVNTLADDTSHSPVSTAATTYGPPATPVSTTVSSGDMNLAGWDMIITPDTDDQGRPDSTTGNLPALAGLISGPAYSTNGMASGVTVTSAGRIDANIVNGFVSPQPATAATAWGTNTSTFPNYSFGWSLDPQNGLYIPPGGTYPDGTPVYTNGQVSYIPALRNNGPLGNTNGFGYSTAPPATGKPYELIGDGYFVLAAGGTPGSVATASVTASKAVTLPNKAIDRFPALPGNPDFVLPNNFFLDITSTGYGPLSATQPPPANLPLPPGNQYYWLYLRRPANPFNPSSEMVVVDSFRFLYAVNYTQGQSKQYTPPAGTFYDQWLAGQNPASIVPTDTKLPASNEFYSLQRLQPFRGGHHISSTPPIGPYGATETTSLGRPQGHSFGYTEQTTPMTGYPASIVSVYNTANPALTTLNAAYTATPAMYGPNLAGSTTAPGTTYTAGQAGQAGPPATPPMQGNQGTPLNNSLLGGPSATTPRGFAPGGLVYDSVGQPNFPADANWDFFPFHDRDFSSVAELLLVPGCPPGLFTKEFAEQNFSFNTATQTATTLFPNTSVAASATTKPMYRLSVLSDSAISAPHTFPYLNDEFYYTPVSVSPSIDTADGASTGPYPTQLGGWTGTGWYKMLDFFEVPSSANGSIGTTDSGENFDWYRNDRRPGLLNLNLIIDEEVFFGLLDDQRINTALAQYGYYLNNYSYQNLVGTNYALSPANTAPFYPNMATLPLIISQVDQWGNPSAFYDISDPFGTTGANGAGSAITSLVPGATIFNTQATTPAGTFLPIYPANNNANTVNTNYVGRGFTYPDPAYSYAGMGAPVTGSTYGQNLITGMKAAFADFLKLRHGGTNFLFGHQAPYSPPGMLALAINNNGSIVPTMISTPSLNPSQAATPSTIYPTPNANAVWPDKPYRSLSYPDINYTVMRPALAVPPITMTSFTPNNTTLGTTPLTFPPPYYYDLVPGSNTSPIQSTTLQAANNIYSGNSLMPNLPTSSGSYTGDPGIRFPWLDLTFTNMALYNSGYNARLSTPMIPPIPPRRLFSVPDTTTIPYSASVTNPGSNAGTFGDLNLNNTSLTNNGLSLLGNPYLADPYAEIVTSSTNPITKDSWSNFASQPPNTTAYSPSNLAPMGVPTLTGNYTVQNYVLSGQRQNPYYRTELLQKVMNLTTVRTHQFAVWITVGFFEVVHVGTPELGISDILGAELDAADGHGTRYRSFFVIDRTKATGFNPYYPGEFRNCVTYRRRIE